MNRREQIIKLISEHPGATVVDAQRIGIPDGTFGRICRELQRDGILEHKFKTHDGTYGINEWYIVHRPVYFTGEVKFPKWLEPLRT